MDKGQLFAATFMLCNDLGGKPLQIGHFQIISFFDKQPSRQLGQLGKDLHEKSRQGRVFDLHHLAIDHMLRQLVLKAAAAKGLHRDFILILGQLGGKIHQNSLGTAGIEGVDQKKHFFHNISFSSV